MVPGFRLVFSDWISVASLQFVAYPPFRSPGLGLDLFNFGVLFRGILTLLGGRDRYESLKQ